jgi:hypothetical protein
MTTVIHFIIIVAVMIIIVVILGTLQDLSPLLYGASSKAMSVRASLRITIWRCHFRPFCDSSFLVFLPSEPRMWLSSFFRCSLHFVLAQLCFVFSFFSLICVRCLSFVTYLAFVTFNAFIPFVSFIPFVPFEVLLQD